MPLINFQLKPPGDIIPFGTGSDQSLHWFGLTDGILWLEPGRTRLYEYNDAFLSQAPAGTSKYVDYFLSRFIEDFTDLFEKIATDISDESYAIARTSTSLARFQETSKKLLDETEEGDFDEAVERYRFLVGWIDERELTASHLIGGPHIGFFRNKDKISIVWHTDQRTGDGTRIWNAANGQFEMTYRDFVKQIEDFGNRFFPAMAGQINTAIKMDWGTVKLDKTRLAEEHIERQSDFSARLRHLLSTH